MVDCPHDPSVRSNRVATRLPVSASEGTRTAPIRVHTAQVHMQAEATNQAQARSRAAPADAPSSAVVHPRNPRLQVPSPPLPALRSAPTPAASSREVGRPVRTRRRPQRWRALTGSGRFPDGAARFPSSALPRTTVTVMVTVTVAPVPAGREPKEACTVGPC